MMLELMLQGAYLMDICGDSTNGQLRRAEMIPSSLILH